ncbi:hypothetical protein EMQ25_05650 [Arsenicitalea aurantiaca]|uniref:Uncharacterized protein n=1 Tax=Arsenicitalea aurantiaca TaxID=1783274 RepID=A0A433XEY9_9HYPH|nr:hypothetical protein [Arsenicitalea aurantiaca]RUT32632.1 hypothetical protein EMQ25_05650 [Arsenicitalea aurantiaca]
MKFYKVVKCDAEGTQTAPSITISGPSPEAAAELALGEPLARRGRTDNLVAKVYYQGSSGANTMQRLYRKPSE